MRNGGTAGLVDEEGGRKGRRGGRREYGPRAAIRARRLLGGEGQGVGSSGYRWVRLAGRINILAAKYKLWDVRRCESRRRFSYNPRGDKISIYKCPRGVRAVSKTEWLDRARQSPRGVWDTSRAMILPASTRLLSMQMPEKQ
jgi:hypothetical protein